MKKLTVLITGANRGLGYEVAFQLAKHGHVIIATARDETKGKRAVAALMEKTGNQGIHFVKMDIRSSASIDKAYAELSKDFEHLDVLINNAGIIINPQGLDRVSREEIQEGLDTNFYGPLLTTQRFLSMLKNGKVINVSSGMGALSDMGSGYAAYRLSKTALNGLTALMNADFAPLGIKAFAVCPGWVHTDMGGKNAPRTPAQGVAGIVELAESETAEGGRFYRDGKIINW